jgi:tRNA dimethylallyltransferase
MSKKIIVILGPTSSGKSEVAIRLAKKFDGEIISADSRQIYREMDIGTGKIASDFFVLKSKVPLKSNKLNIFWSNGVAHYLIDIINPTANYNVVNFKKDAEVIIKDILKRGKLPIICGGTGFWIKAVVDKVNFPEVKPDWVLRNRLSNQPVETLFKKLKKLDPERTKTIDAKNKVRLIRAIEICKAIGKVPRIIEHKTFNIKHDFLQIGIKKEKEKLYKDIRKRLQKRFGQGMIQEVEKLHSENKLSWKKIQSFGLGYHWIPEYLKGNIKSKEELIEKVYLAEKDYAQRQLTWFKKDPRIVWLKNYTSMQNEVKKFIQN